MHVHHVQPVVEVFAKSALGEARLEVAVRRGDEATVDGDRLDAADPFELLLLQCAEQLHLHADRNLRDLIQEQRATMRKLEAPGLARHRAGERASLVSEELAFEQVRRDGGTVDADERPVLAGVILMQSPGDQFFARPAFAGDQDRAGCACNLFDHVVDAVHRLRLPDDSVAAALAWVSAHVLLGKLAGPRCLADDRSELRLIERLGHVVERAQLQRLDRGVDRPVRGDHDHWHVGKTLADGLEHLHPIELRHAQVGDQNIDVMLCHGLEHGLPVGDTVDFVSVVQQLRLQDAPQVVLVIGNENLFGFTHSPECSADWSGVQIHQTGSARGAETLLGGPDYGGPLLTRPLVIEHGCCLRPRQPLESTHQVFGGQLVVVAQWDLALLRRDVGRLGLGCCFGRGRLRGLIESLVDSTLRPLEQTPSRPENGRFDGAGLERLARAHGLSLGELQALLERRDVGIAGLE